MHVYTYVCMYDIRMYVCTRQLRACACMHVSARASMRQKKNAQDLGGKDIRYRAPRWAQSAQTQARDPRTLSHYPSPLPPPRDPLPPPLRCGHCAHERIRLVDEGQKVFSMPAFASLPCLSPPMCSLLM